MLKAMADKSRILRTPGLGITLDETSKAPKRIQIMRAGTFYHPDYGQFTIDTAMMKKMSENFAKNVRGIDIAIDYKHDNEDVAAGWVKGVSLSDDEKECWAEVEWTPEGARVLADKEFRYFSPEFHPNYQDNETMAFYGPTLLGGGLTNRPTIKHMEPVVELSEQKYSTDAGEKIHDSSVKKESEQGSDSEQKTKKKEVKAMDPKTMDPASLDQMSPEEIKALCVQMLAKMKEMGDQMAASEKKMVDAEAAKCAAEKKESFAKLLSEGKAVAAQEKAFLANDMVEFAKLSQPVKLTETGKGNVESPAVIATKQDAEAEVDRLAKKLLSEKKASTLDRAYSMVLSERKDLGEKIYGKQGE